MNHHTLEVSTEVLDHIAKSLMQSIHANTRRRRRLETSGQTNTRTWKECVEEADALDEGLAQVRAAQNNSWRQATT